MVYAFHKLPLISEVVTEVCGARKGLGLGGLVTAFGFAPKVLLLSLSAAHGPAERRVRYRLRSQAVFA